MLTLLVLMTGLAPISLYMLVPALPVIATTFGRDISVAQMTVSLYMVGIALSQLIMGPLSDKFGRRWGIIIPGVLPKWAIFAPVFIPLFLRLGVAPQTVLAAYRVGDSPVNVITPLMV